MATGVYTLVVATPTLSPVTGTYTTVQTITMSVATAGATIRYTTDGSDPTTGSTAYSVPVSVGTTTTIRAAAFLTGWTPSAIAAASYTMNFGQLAAPTFSPAPQSYLDSVTVTISAAAEATIHYTTSGSDPTVSSALYTGPVPLTVTTPLKAGAWKVDYSPSPISSSTYTLKVATPILNPTPGSYPSGTAITFTAATAGSTLHYTTNGVDPTEADPSIASGATLPVGNFTLKVRAFRDGCVASDVTGGAYTAVPLEESVTWAETWGTTAAGGTLTKIGPAGWNAGGASTKALVSGDGYLEFSVAGLADAVCGLSAQARQGYESVDFALRFGSDGSVTVLEAGVARASVGTYVATDRFRVAVENGSVRYYRGAALLYTSTGTPTYSLTARASIHTSGGTIASASLSGALLENVAWTAAVNATGWGSGLAKSGGADAAWNAGAVSTRGIATEGYVEFVVESVSGQLALGLSHGNTDQALEDIDFALHLSPIAPCEGPACEANLTVYEAGEAIAVVGTCIAGDHLRIAVDGGVVSYSKNGSLLYSSSAAASSPLVVDTSLYNLGIALRGAVLSGDLVDAGVAPPVFSVPTGHYAAPQSVVVTADPTADVFYTTNGADPTPADTLIASGQSVTVSASTTLKARAWKTGLITSSVSRAIYTFGATATEPVDWTNGVNVGVSPAGAFKTLSKSGGSSAAWDAGAVSTRAIASMEGYVEFVVDATGGDRMLGLSRGDSDQDFRDLDFGFCLSGSVLQIYESGNYRGAFGPYATGDQLRIAVEGGTVKYRRNGQLLFVSNVLPTFPLLVDTSIKSIGAALTSVAVSGGLVDTARNHLRSVRPAAGSPDRPWSLSRQRRQARPCTTRSTAARRRRRTAHRMRLPSR